MCTKMDDSFMFDQIEHAYDQFEKAYDQLDKNAEVVTAAEAEQAGRAQESFDQAADNLKAQISALEKTLSDDKDAFALSVQRLHSLTVQPRLATVAEEETVRVHDEEPGEGKPAVHSMVRMAGFTGYRVKVHMSSLKQPSDLLVALHGRNLCIQSRNIDQGIQSSDGGTTGIKIMEKNIVLPPFVNPLTGSAHYMVTHKLLQIEFEASNSRDGSFQSHAQQDIREMSVIWCSGDSPFPATCAGRIQQEVIAGLKQLSAQEDMEMWKVTAWAHRDVCMIDQLQQQLAGVRGLLSQNAYLQNARAENSALQDTVALCDAKLEELRKRNVMLQAECAQKDIDLTQACTKLEARTTPQRLIASWTHRAMAAGFKAWRVGAEQRGNAHRRMSKVLVHLMQSTVAKAFQGWSANAANLRHRRQLLCRVIGRWQHRMLALFYDNWHVNAKAKRRADDVRSRVVRHMLHRQLAVAFDTWHCQTNVQRRVRLSCHKLIVRMKNARAYSAFASWHGKARAKRRAKDVCHRVVCHMMYRQLAVFFGSWYANARKQRRTMEICARAVLKMMCRRLSVAFDTLYARVTAQRKGKEKCQRLLARWYSDKLWQHFRAWCAALRMLQKRHAMLQAECAQKDIDRTKVCEEDEAAPRRIARTQSWPQLTSSERTRLHSTLQVLWCQLVDEFYTRSKESIFLRGRAITWKEFVARSNHHAKTALPYLLFDHNTMGKKIVDADLSKIPDLDFLPQKSAGKSNASLDASGQDDPSFFSTVMAGVIATAQVKRTDKQVAEHVLEIRNASLESYCKNLECYNDDLLLNMLDPARSNTTIRGRIWKEVSDAQTGDVGYWNIVTGETRWEPSVRCAPLVSQSLPKQSRASIFPATSGFSPGLSPKKLNFAAAGDASRSSSHNSSTTQWTYQTMAATLERRRLFVWT